MFREVTILVVDDAPEDRFLIGAELTACGCKVICAADEAEAYAIARSEALDAVIVDLFLGHVLGLDLVHRLRSLPAMRDTPIVLLTAHDPTGIESEAFRRGATAVMVKSFGNERLRSLVEPLLVTSGGMSGGSSESG